MARIEISMEEYNALKAKIKTLEDTNGQLAKDNAILKEHLREMKEALEDVAASSLFERIFLWRKIINGLKNAE